MIGTLCEVALVAERPVTAQPAFWVPERFQVQDDNTSEKTRLQKVVDVFSPRRLWSGDPRPQVPPSAGRHCGHMSGSPGRPPASSWKHRADPLTWQGPQRGDVDWPCAQADGGGFEIIAY